MIDLKLDPDTWDLVILGGDFVIVSGDEELIQHIGIRLRTILGEWYQDPTVGFIDKRRFFGKGASEAHFRARLIAEVEAVQQIAKGSAAITELTTDTVARRRRVKWQARKASGDPLRGSLSLVLP